MKISYGKIYVGICLLVGIIFANPLQAQQLPKGVKKVTSVEGITEYNLENGLKVLLFPDQSKPTITVNITYLVGSRHEGYGETGMAHLLEHMVFKGTPRHPNIMQELTEHGTRPNGTTWYDRTNYYETFAATEENLKWALDLEADRMVNSFIAKKDLDSEMTVVRNEFESGENSPFNSLMERVIDVSYSWHNYGKSTIGSRADLENVPIENLQAFYKKYYQPDNAVLMVAGKIDEAKTIALVQDYFGKIPKPNRVLPKTYTQEPVQDGERTVEVRRVGDVQYVMASYHISPGAHEDYESVAILGELLSGEPYGRLYKSLVETKKATSQFAYAFQLHDPGFILLGAEVLKEKSLEEAKKAFVATLDSVSLVKPTQEDLERAKTNWLKNWDLEFRNSERVGLSISEYIATGDWRLAFISRDRVRKITADDIVRVGQKYFVPTNRSLGVFIPEAKTVRAHTPQAPDIATLVKDYKGEAAVAQGEDFDAAPANIEKRTQKMIAQGTIKQALLPKKTRGNVVTARITLRYGDVNSLKNKATVSALTAAMLDKGTKGKSRQEIKDTFDKLNARVSVDGGANQTVVSIETTRENLPAVITLVTEILKQPSFDSNEFEKLKEENIAAIESQRSDPQSIAVLEFRRKISQYPKGDIRYVESLDESLEAIKSTNLEAVKQFHREFYGATDATIAVVGDFDQSAIKNLITKELGTWKSPKPFKRIESPYVAAKPANIAIETPDKANAMFVAGFSLPLQDTDPDYPALILGNFMLGQGMLNSRLATRIRVKDGLSYGVGSQLSASSLDKNGSFLAYAIYAPENLSKLEIAFKEEMERAIKDGFTEEEVKAAKSGYLQGRQVSRSQDAALAGTLNTNLYLNRTMEFDEKFEKQIAALTPAQINAAFKRYLDYQKLVIVKAGDFAKSAGSPAKEAAGAVGGSPKK